ncbi:MAG TPA: serine hydrolase [Verrucomicrobiae bacterium]|nr:serine hydrolase [Verrucomicrobiae bacterium]
MMKATPKSLAGIGIVLLAGSVSPSTLPRSTPEAQGVSSAAIREFVAAADRDVNVMNSFMLVRHGQVIAEGWWTPYAPDVPHMLYSLSKSFTSTAVGLAVAEGKLIIDDEVLKFFPEDAPSEPTNNLKAMRVHDLLRMSTGHQVEPRLSGTNGVPWTKLFLAHPVPNKPGTHFLYNTAGTYMQSAIVQKATGQTVLDYLRPRLFEPLGIDNPAWGTSPQGISLGGYGLSIRTEDIAKFGQLYLQKGQWHGKQLVPAAWVEAATARQTSNGSNPKSDWDQGYGYQFWRCRHGAYRGDGAFGQYCLVMPEQDAVVSITSGTRDMQRVLNLIWDKLLPAFQQLPLPENKEEQKRLKDTLGRLSLSFPEGAATSPIAAKLSGKEFHFPANNQKLEAVKVEPAANGGGMTLSMRINGSEYRLPCAYQSWAKARLSAGTLGEQAVAASGAWTAEGYNVRLCLYETPTIISVNLRPSGDELLYDAEYNVAFGPTRQPRLIGRAH